jgi:hypothetical protein
MPTLTHLLFGAAVAILIAIAMVLLLPGVEAPDSQEASMGAPASQTLPSFSQ